MDDLINTLQEHAQRYPQMKPQDVIKLVYQRNFGPGHAVENEAMNLCGLLEEMETAEDTGILTEPLGNHLCRLYLGKAKTLFKAEDIEDIFVRTAAVHKGSMYEFMRDLKTVQKNIEIFRGSFTEEEYLSYAAWYRGKGYPAVHHSSTYSEAYAPHYRVVYEGFVRSLENIQI